MAVYTVTFFHFDGSPSHQTHIECESDDDAIDTVGDSDHPHEIDLHDGERHVVRFPSWPAFD